MKSLLRKCVRCRRVAGKPYSQPDPPPLPSVRVKDARPFEITGVDFTGALHVKKMGDNKVYICLFTCGVTRAVHLEVVEDLSVETFLQALRRFAARRSLPRILISDNASTFQAAAKGLEELIISTQVSETLSTLGVQWKFIPKRAPWYGGFWERLIGLTKMALRKVLATQNIIFLMYTISCNSFTPILIALKISVTAHSTPQINYVIERCIENQLENFLQKI